MNQLDKFLLERHDLSSDRKEFYRYVFKTLGKFTDHPFNLDREEMSICLEKLEQVARTRRSWNSYVAAIRVLYKWMNQGEYPDSVKHVKAKRVRSEDEVKNKILTEQEVQSLIVSATNPRDKALVAVCFEGGFRLGELLSLTVGACERASYGYDVTVTGKTGTRRMPLVTMAPLLEMWLYCHPAKNDQQAPLWLRMKGAFKGISKTQAHNTIKALAKKAGLKRNVHWHMLRHTQATLYARGNVNEQQMRMIFGWTRNSNMPSVYTHLSARDYQDTVLRLRGVDKVEHKVKPSVMVPRKCWKCGEMNPFDKQHCGKCGTPLDQKAAQRMIQREQMMDDLLTLLSKPGMLDKFMEKMDSL